MLRFLIVTGLLLMGIGFGAAGWQYWQSLPPQAAPALTGPGPTIVRQSWLISPSGGLVAQDEVRTYLAQDRFVPGRIVRIRREADLGTLLADGEKLPEPAFLEVLADIRAPKVADGLCPVLLRDGAVDCAVHAARVVEGSVDPVQGTAMFQVDLVYRLAEPEDGLPDLAARVLQTETVQVSLEAGAEGTGSPETALQVTLAAVADACAADGVGEVCRPTQIAIDWAPGQPVRARAGIAWLDPLPKGMFVAPPLDTAQGG